MKYIALFICIFWLAVLVGLFWLFRQFLLYGSPDFAAGLVGGILWGLGTRAVCKAVQDSINDARDEFLESAKEEYEKAISKDH